MTKYGPAAIALFKQNKVVSLPVACCDRQMVYGSLNLSTPEQQGPMLLVPDEDSTLYIG